MSHTVNTIKAHSLSSSFNNLLCFRSQYGIKMRSILIFTVVLVSVTFAMVTALKLTVTTSVHSSQLVGDILLPVTYFTEQTPDNFTTSKLWSQLFLYVRNVFYSIKTALSQTAQVSSVQNYGLITSNRGVQLAWLMRNFLIKKVVLQKCVCVVHG